MKHINITIEDELAALKDTFPQECTWKMVIDLGLQAYRAGVKFCPECGNILFGRESCPCKREELL